MRVLICGSRTWKKTIPIDMVVAGLCQVFGTPNVTIIEGESPGGGADLYAALSARERGCGLEPYPVDNAVDGPWPAAGHRRNQRMLDASKPDLCIGFTSTWPATPGTKSMLTKAKAAGVPTYVFHSF